MFRDSNHDMRGSEHGHEKQNANENEGPTMRAPIHMTLPVLRLAPLLLSLAAALMATGCEEALCPVGTPGCACQEDDRCRLESLSCVEGLCVETDPACPPGTEGCGCLTRARCRLDSLVCEADTCVARPAPEPQPEPGPELTCKADGGPCIPADPTCYTPCSGDLARNDGSVRRCSGEGLMEGCLQGAICDRGSCVPTGMDTLDMGALAVLPGQCERPTDCPDFQTCILGRCYSECERSEDCADGYGCRSKVCRQECGPDQACAQRGHVCNDGACLPHARTETQMDPLPQGARFTLCVGDAQPGEFGDGPGCPDARLPFTAAATEGVFRIHNLSDDTRTFVVRKSEQHVQQDDGRTQVLQASAGDAPLPWLQVGTGIPMRVQELAVDVPARDSLEITLSDARKADLSRWVGWVDVEDQDSGLVDRVQLLYGEGAGGRWAGQVYYFGNFEDGSAGAQQGNAQTALQAWSQDRDNLGLADAVPNAFVQAWARFRRNLFSLNEMEALISATVQQSWQLPRVEELCAEQGYGAGAACAPFGGGPGSPPVLPYTSDVRNNRIPSGVVELGFSLAVAGASPAQVADPTLCDGNPHCFVGRIDSDQALQYAGYPEVTLTFDDDPTECVGGGGGGSGACIAGVRRLSATVAVGGRYTPRDDEPACGNADFAQLLQHPWLVKGFDPPGGGGHNGERVLRSCRQTHLPYLGMTAANQSFAAANPVPDGKSRVRHVELLDGVLIEQHSMLLLLRETVDGFQGGAPLASYALVELKRDPISPPAEETLGNPPEQDLGSADPAILDSTCDPALVATVTGDIDPRPLSELSALQLRRLGRAVVRGDDTSINDATGPAPVDLSDESVHYLCVFQEDAVLDGNSDATVVQREVFGAGPGGNVPCPPNGQVIYFATGHDTQNDPQAFAAGFDPSLEACNTYTPGEKVEYCLDTLKNWVERGRPLRISTDGEAVLGALDGAGTTFDLVFQCDLVGPNRPARCDIDRFDYLAGKTFLERNDSRVFFDPIESEIERAFRYRTQFASRSNTNVGFVPEICSGNSGLAPYCYEPSRIAAIAKRVDCALAIYHGGASLDDDTRDTLRAYLDKNFSALQIASADADPVLESGFERLYAELLIMLGDDAFVAAFGSRFDLAATRQLAFEGARFEPGGIDLSGFLGFEMYKLYEASQHYEMVTDRFYRLSPRIWQSVTGPVTDSYVGQPLVTSYLDHVIRASTQLARASSEIAERYHAMNRPDLARSVLERAYTRAYQESGILSRLMTAIMQSLDAAAVPQVIAEVEKAQRSYRVAMLDMKTAYGRITEQQQFFGLPPDYIPFPALNEDDVNGFEVILNRAKDRLEVAADQEATALERSREFDVDDAEFQRELVDLRNNFEAQLSAICGGFTGTDGRVYPSIPRYAHLAGDLDSVSDPCGLTSGDLWLASADLQTRYVELQAVRTQVDNLEAQRRDSIEWVAKQCTLINEDVAAFLEKQGAVDDLEHDNEIMQASVAAADRVLAFVDGLTSRVADAGDSNSPWGATIRSSTGATFAVASVAHFIAATALEGQVVTNQNRMRKLERAYEARQIGRQCDYLSAELVFTLRDLQREVSLLQLDTLNAVWNVQTELARITGLDNERRRMEAEWDETNQLVINVAAAKNDPNIRIYKNDAVINAERSFDRAVQEAYRATRIYEYYTASSYAALDKLFLVRMVDAGDVNLRNYLTDLESAFFDFEDQYGNPDTRVHRVSVLEDVLKVPRYSTDGLNRVLSVEERTQRFRRMLQEPTRLNDDGHLAMKFSTSFDSLSPLTVNHKILFIEVEVLGSDPNLSVGDNIGRFYIRQLGTGVVRDPAGADHYYAFPARTAVVNPVINGDRDFGQDSDGAIAGATRTIFRSYRFRERPFVQTDWELVLNQVTELVNQDINLGGIDDILLNVFYTDFTPQPASR